MVAPTNKEQLVVELINRARADPEAEVARYGIGLNDDLAPGTISSDAKQPLAVSFALVDSSLVHSASMVADDYFSHTGSDGSIPSDRMFDAGWTFENNGWSTGENLAYRGSTDPDYSDLVSTIALQHRDLVESEGHRVNVMGDQFSEIGVGQVIGDYEGSNSTLLTQNFADAGRTFLTGVAIDDGDDDDFYDVGEGLGGITVTATGSAGTFTTTTWASGGYSLDVDSGTYSVTFSGGTFGTSGYDAGTFTVTDENVKVDANADDFTRTTITVSELEAGDPAVLFSQIRDFDGNDLGNPQGWVQLGKADVQNDGDDEFVYVNPTLGRWATLGPDANDTIDFTDHGTGGETRVVGVYLDPLVEAGQVVKGSDTDSARRFENDLRIDNLTLLEDSDADYDGDGLQQVYFKTADGTAYLHALMHADGNIRYANYQSEQQMVDYLEDNGYGQGTYDDWLIA